MHKYIDICSVYTCVAILENTCDTQLVTSTDDQLPNLSQKRVAKPVYYTCIII